MVEKHIKNEISTARNKNKLKERELEDLIRESIGRQEVLEYKLQGNYNKKLNRDKFKLFRSCSSN